MSIGDPLAQFSPDFENAKELQKLAGSQLDRAREVAEKWRTALSGLVVAVVGFGVFNRDAISILALWAKLTLAVCLIGVLATSIYGLYRAARASFGQLDLQDTSRSIRALKHSKAVEATNDIRYAQVYTGISVLLLTSAILLSWFAPEADPTAFVQGTRGDQ